MGRRHRPRVQIVADHFGDEILQHGLLRQAGDLLQIGELLETLKASLMRQRRW